MARSRRRSTLVGLALAAAVAPGCTPGVAPVHPRPELPQAATEAGRSAPAPEPPPPAGEEHVPERCRDGHAETATDCRPRRVVVTSTDIEILDDIAFTGNTAELTPTSYRTLDRVVQTLIMNPSILELQVRGHSDSLLHPAERAEVARRRAEVVARYLVEHGVPLARVSTYGASDSELMYPPDDPRNRRVELLIAARGE